MRYEEFSLTNFKGVNRTTVGFRGSDGANVVTLIGLNESGKTTILEGIYSFSPDPESKNLFDDIKVLGPDATSKIPRSRLYNFSDDIVVQALVAVEDGEWGNIAAEILRKMDLVFDVSALPTKFTIRDVYTYKNSKLDKRNIYWGPTFRVKTRRATYFRTLTEAESANFFSILRTRLPSIAYFPTFLSDVPARIYLDGHEDDQKNEFYKKVFQDILNTVGSDITIESQIVARLKPPATFEGSLAETIATFFGSDRKGMVQQVIDKASAKLSSVILTRWNQMFEKHPVGKEIVIEWGIDEDADNSRIDPYISFAVRDGANRYNIADRSLGFRWFFCFLLFTQFRAQRAQGMGTLFLFDEPASNLHASAQEKLLDSFNDVCRAPNALIYSTHSPYMINPMWLDQAYIVENETHGSDLDDIATMSAEPDTSILASSYHDFVEKSPQRVSHFQPVMDRLEVKPSLMQVRENTVLVEGKSDFVILSSLLRTLEPTFHLVPAHGATTMAPLIALLKGWGWPFLVLLDGDNAGEAAKARYKSEYFLGANIMSLKDAAGSKIKGIESLLAPEDVAGIKTELGLAKSPSKKQIYNYFLEAEAADKTLKLKTRKSKEFKTFLQNVEKVFQR